MESKTDLLVKPPCRVMAVYFLSYIVDFIIMSDNYAIYMPCDGRIFFKLYR